ncbi:DUF2550 domain-containing protein [Nocardioides sp. Y6]|uniref:DUF2550 domain-containing protein n=1 Tax=Nocardioides malaquae TaxID=2773426 RepID=A0ABR9RPZ3_9ACTN|nr:DUF2550 domain-containing protein [Nocardioides malaquae]MBE7323636.1 DUF2550 domain-containing protein [Nocardioides malaquae]
MHTGWLLVLDVVGVLLVVVLLLCVALLVRRRIISRTGGTFEVSHRSPSAHAGRGWTLGVGRFTGESLEWFRIFSLSPQPSRVWNRNEIAYEGRRAPEGPEVPALYADHVVVVCATPEGEVELAMSDSSLMGFQSWLESGPPGTNWDSKPLR